MKNIIIKTFTFLALIQTVFITNLTAQNFAIIGDFGIHGATHGPNAQKVADLVKFRAPEFVVTVGDNNYPDGKSETLCANITERYYSFIDPNYTEADLADCLVPNYTGIGNANTRFYPSPGNHDYDNHPDDDAAPYYAYFDNIPSYYDFVKGDVHFFSMNSNKEEPNGNGPNSVQANWLKEKLQASTARWKIVYFHHAAYTSGSHATDPNNVDHRWDYKEWGATAVISGHDHNYERLNIDCLPYFVNGLGGAGIRNVGPPIEGSQFIYNEKHGAMFINADANLITFEFYAISEDNPEGELIDSYTIDDLYPYTNCGEDPPPANCCPEGSTWDGANCYFGINVPNGYNPFIWENAFYTHYGPDGPGDCPPGSVDDGAHCRFRSYPSQYHGFIWNNSFYTQENCEADPQLCCPPGSIWDGANCYYDINIPDGYEPFIAIDNGLYVSSNSVDDCPLGTEPREYGCYLGVTMPEGIDGFIYKGSFYAKENCDVDKCCPEGTVWNGVTCDIPLEWEDAEVVILNDNSIALEYDESKGCPENTTLDASGRFCLTGLSIPSGFDGVVKGDGVEVEANCNSCCPEGFEFNGFNCERKISLEGADIHYTNGQLAISSDCLLFPQSNNCCPEGFYNNGGDCFLRASSEELTINFMWTSVSLRKSALNCLEGIDKLSKRAEEKRREMPSTVLQPSGDAVMIYPNPAHSIVNIEVDLDDSRKYTLEVFDHLGRIITSRQFSEKVELNISSLAKGVHVVKVLDEDEKVIGIKKLIVVE